MAPSSSITFVGDILPLWVPYVPPERSLVGNFDGVLLDRNQFFHKVYATPVHLKNMDVAFLMKFLALNLANNHSHDAGPGAFKRTVEMIRSMGIVPYGFKENPIAELRIGKHFIGIIGCVERSFSRPSSLIKEENVLDLIRSVKGKYDYLYVTPHWGGKSEFTSFAAPGKIHLAEKWIDAGAAGVFGHRPRAVQGFHSRQERPIYASLGNFSYSHPQCDLYPISRFGMGVEAAFQRDSVKYTNHYFYDRKPFKRTLEAEKYFEVLSSLDYSNLTWARLVGRVYTTKSFSSWKFRLWNAKNVIDPIKFLVWLFLPQTILMALMSLFEIKPLLFNLERRYEKIGP
jgi:hypothetical protein